MAVPTEFGYVMLGFSPLLAWYGWRHAANHRLVDETPTVSVGEIREEGVVELEGEVVGGDTFESPFRRRECVLAAWEVQEWDEHGEFGTWQTLATGVYARPFALDDGTGEITTLVGRHASEGGTLRTIDSTLAGTGVATEEVLCEFRSLPNVIQHPPDEEPPIVREFLEEEDTVSPSEDSITNLIDVGSAHRERRYLEQTVDPGDDLYILGTVRADPGVDPPFGPADATVQPPEVEPLVLSTLSGRELKASFGRRRFALPGAVVLAAVGAAIAFGVP